MACAAVAGDSGERLAGARDEVFLPSYLAAKGFETAKDMSVASALSWTYGIIGAHPNNNTGTVVPDRTSLCSKACPTFDVLLLFRSPKST
eukprot:1252962-Amphidinium_carterae.1